MRVLLIIVAVSALASAAPKLNVKVSLRVIGGKEVIPHSVPYQVFLEMFCEDEEWYCGGSLISQNYVLTAAHCVVAAARTIVTLGAHKSLEAESSQIVLLGTNITVHEDYDGAKDVNDIAVVQLPETVNVSADVQVVALPSRSHAEDSYVGVSARLTGWGLTDLAGDHLSEVLNYADVEIISNEECEESYRSLSPSVLCTSGKRDTGACSGDSGGPLTVDGVQVGVSSYGIVFCMSGYPSVFTRVTSFLDWIQNNTDVQIN